jgi:hypothetical protein
MQVSLLSTSFLNAIIGCFVPQHDKRRELQVVKALTFENAYNQETLLLVILTQEGSVLGDLMNIKYL